MESEVLGASRQPSFEIRKDPSGQAGVVGAMKKERVFDGSVLFVSWVSRFLCFPTGVERVAFCSGSLPRFSRRTTSVGSEAVQYRRFKVFQLV